MKTKRPSVFLHIWESRKVDTGKLIILVYAYNIFGVCHASCILQGMQYLNGRGDVESQPYRELCSKTGF